MGHFRKLRYSWRVSIFLFVWERHENFPDILWVTLSTRTLNIYVLYTTIGILSKILVPFYISLRGVFSWTSWILWRLQGNWAEDNKKFCWSTISLEIMQNESNASLWQESGLATWSWRIIAHHLQRTSERYFVIYDSSSNLDPAAIGFSLIALLCTE